jgi:hypothetical protein
MSSVVVESIGDQVAADAPPGSAATAVAATSATAKPSLPLPLKRPWLFIGRT